jgi:hypothetical protein
LERQESYLSQFAGYSRTEGSRDKTVEDELAVPPEVFFELECIIVESVH